MSLAVRFFAFLTEFWVLLPVALGITLTFAIDYLKAQNAFLKEWEPTLKALGFAVPLIIGFIVGQSTNKKAEAPAPAPAPNSQIWRFVTTSHLNIRECAGADCPKVATLEKGSKLEYLGRAQYVLDAQGRNTQWLYTTMYSGRVCAQADKQKNCVEWVENRSVKGWVSKTYLLSL
jgi:hypothetical protein